jgi:hypothetical protein
MKDNFIIPSPQSWESNRQKYESSPLTRISSSRLPILSEFSLFKEQSERKGVPLQNFLINSDLQNQYNFLIKKVARKAVKSIVASSLKIVEEVSGLGSILKPTKAPTKRQVTQSFALRCNPTLRGSFEISAPYVPHRLQTSSKSSRIRKDFVNLMREAPKEEFKINDSLSQLIHEDSKDASFVYSHIERFYLSNISIYLSICLTSLSI